MAQLWQEGVIAFFNGCYVSEIDVRVLTMVFYYLLYYRGINKGELKKKRIRKKEKEKSFRGGDYHRILFNDGLHLSVSF